MNTSDIGDTRDYDSDFCETSDFGEADIKFDSSAIAASIATKLVSDTSSEII